MTPFLININKVFNKQEVIEDIVINKSVLQKIKDFINKFKL